MHQGGGKGLPKLSWGLGTSTADGEPATMEHGRGLRACGEDGENDGRLGWKGGGAMEASAGGKGRRQGSLARDAVEFARRQGDVARW
ncbi:hypothetical protein E2562_017894 [Oryza meyeriana var. granulata]|uniref:Uncharacterized protein n=1 Tax=Oryza meyeriana var. granulata TaxID=110450 RepID=A0A6G1CRM0_9ORYZ|nr:hypothetical protein E2562_017894 [Oryza meyeriana var. granulata]